jgi:hypothetical protein
MDQFRFRTLEKHKISGDEENMTLLPWIRSQVRFSLSLSFFHIDHVPLKVVKSFIPEAHEVPYPLLDFMYSGIVKAIETPLSILPHTQDRGLPKDLQVLRNGRGGDVEVPTNFGGAEFSMLCHQRGNVPSGGIAEGRETIHATIIN